MTIRDFFFDKHEYNVLTTYDLNQLIFKLILRI